LDSDKGIFTSAARWLKLNLWTLNVLSIDAVSLCQRHTQHEGIDTTVENRFTWKLPLFSLCSAEGNVYLETPISVPIFWVFDAVVDGFQRFGGTCFLHLQHITGCRNSEEQNMNLHLGESF
jgi:hypothetical protein